jgi:hypothetical protein
MSVLKIMVAGLALLIVFSGPAPVCPLSATPALANSCTQNCRRQHNQCRIRTKGSSRCDAQLRRCLRRCLK